MQQTYTAAVKHEADAWIGWIEEIPGVNCQEATREELLESLRITLAEAIEFSRADAISAAGHGFEEVCSRHTDDSPTMLLAPVCKL